MKEGSLSIIAIYSPLERCGKSTLAAMIQEDLEPCGVPTVRAAFSTAMKNMAAELLRSFGFDEERIRRHIHGDLKEMPIAEMDGISAREIVASLGTQWGRQIIHENLWVFPVRNWIDQCRASGANGCFIFDDLRFPSEYEMLKERGALFVRITRPEAFRRAGVTGMDAERRAYSEGLLEGHEFDICIDNCGSLEMLRDSARQIENQVFHPDEPALACEEPVP